jgi:hypothetical protein
MLRLPASATKAKRPLVLPMSTFVHELLVARRAIGDAGGFVFPGRRYNTHLTGNVGTFDVIAKATGIKVSAHDLRRTFATGLAAGNLGADIRNYRVYLITRAICVRIYQKLVRDDLLPRILHPGIVSAYGATGAPFLDSQPLDSLPSEFAHVLRFGHAMVRPNYVFNDLNTYGQDLTDMMLSTSGARPWRMPLDGTWMVQWSHFFGGGSRKPNLSRRIGPHFSGGLFSGEIFGPIDATGSIGLPYRDLLSSGLVPQWSVPVLAAEIRTRRPSIAQLSPLLLDDQARTREIREWFGDHRQSSDLSDEDMDYLAGDPPLFFYVLFEAARDMSGKRLGTLGSLILAETLYRALREGNQWAPAQGAEIPDAFEELGRVVFGRSGLGPAIEECMPDIGTMAGLIAYVAPSPLESVAQRAYA